MWSRRNFVYNFSAIAICMYNANKGHIQSTEYLKVSLPPLDGGLSVELSPDSTTVYITDNDGIYKLVHVHLQCMLMCLIKFFRVSLIFAESSKVRARR